MTDSRRRLVLGGLFVLLALQACFSLAHPRNWYAQRSPGMPPNAALTVLGALGERYAPAYGMSLYLQNFDAQAGHIVPIRSLAIAHLAQWLERIGELAPRAGYGLLLATRVYAEPAQVADARVLLDQVHRRFLADPDRHWAWLAQAVFVARHRLGDPVLARDYAHSLRLHATGANVPRWARDMEIFLLAGINEVDAARVLLGALIDSGQIQDPHELNLMIARLRSFERDTRPDERSQSRDESADKTIRAPLERNQQLTQ